MLNQSMHELRIAEDLKNIVLEAARHGNLKQVTRVNVCFGRMVQIVPDIFEFAFREFVRDTIAGDTEISLEILPVKMNCTLCGNNFDVKADLFLCPVCGSVDLKLLQGKELFIKSIEGE